MRKEEGESEMVYVISDGSGFVKIGNTSNLNARLKQLQCGNPRDLKVLYTIPDGGIDLERALHMRYEKYRISTIQIETCEWFDEKCLEDLKNLTREDCLELEKNRTGKYSHYLLENPISKKCTCAELEKATDNYQKLQSEVTNKRQKIKALNAKVKELESENLILKSKVQELNTIIDSNESMTESRTTFLRSQIKIRRHAGNTNERKYIIHKHYNRRFK